MAASPSSRAESWYRDPKWSDEVRMGLVINELDEFDARIERVAKATNRKLNWMIGLFATATIGLILNLVAIVASR